MNTERLVCELEDGRLVNYSIAFRLDSEAAVHEDYVHIGIGTIFSYNEKPYTLKHKFRFYRCRQHVSNYKYRKMADVPN